MNPSIFDDMAAEFRGGAEAETPEGIAAAIDRAVARVPRDPPWVMLFVVHIDLLSVSPPERLRRVWRDSPATMPFADTAMLLRVLAEVRDRVAARAGASDLYARERANPPGFQHAMGVIFDGYLEFFGGDEEKLLTMALSQIELFAGSPERVIEDARDAVAFIDAIVAWGPEQVRLALYRGNSTDLRGDHAECVRVLRRIRDRIAERWGITWTAGAAGWPRRSSDGMAG